MLRVSPFDRCGGFLDAALHNAGLRLVRAFALRGAVDLMMERGRAPIARHSDDEKVAEFALRDLTYAAGCERNIGRAGRGRAESLDYLGNGVTVTRDEHEIT